MNSWRGSGGSRGSESDPRNPSEPLLNVALVDQGRQGLIFLIHFAKSDVTTRQARPHVYN
jgi:hypothetical protein